MARKVDLEQLVGTAEIAARLNVGRTSVVHDWRRRYPDFPQPVLELRMGQLWLWPAVESWARATGRL